MIKTLSNRHSPGILFIGDSFTWGQGLYYYSGLSTLSKTDKHGSYIKENITAAQRKFMQAYRFPRLVANYFDTFEFVQERNGGSNIHNIQGWDHTIFNGDLLSNVEVDKDTLNDSSEWSWFTSTVTPNRISPKEIGLCIFQITETTRDPIYVDSDTGFMDLKSFMQRPEFEGFCKITNTSIDQFLETRKQLSISYVKRFIMKLEEHGIPTLIITYPEDAVQIILADSYLSERFSALPYNGSNLNYLAAGAVEKICNDHTFSFDDHPKDQHMSMKSHRIIADILIREIIGRDLWKHTKIYY